MNRAALMTAAVFAFARAAFPEDEPATADRIFYKSPDGKFALRIEYEDALQDSADDGEQSKPDDDISYDGIAKLAIVSLPDKKPVVDLTEEVFSEGNNFIGVKLLWSADSKWCAWYYAFPRIGYTTVYRREGDQFKVATKPEDLRVEAKGDVRNEYIEPKKWVKPGTLALEELLIFRGEEGDFCCAFTAQFDGKGKFKVVSKKRLRSPAARNDE